MGPTIICGNKIRTVSFRKPQQANGKSDGYAGQQIVHYHQEERADPVDLLPVALLFLLASLAWAVILVLILVVLVVSVIAAGVMVVVTVTMIVVLVIVLPEPALLHHVAVAQPDRCVEFAM